MGVERLLMPLMNGAPCGWFAPTYKYLEEVWRDFVRVLGPIIKSSNATQRRIELITGGSIEFWSLEDDDAGRSRRYVRVIIDEAAKARNLEAAWNEAIRPTLADFKGDADFYSTPKGHDFFWRLYTRGLDETNKEWACWRMPTAANPYIDPDEIEAARLELPERVFQQEFLAEFIEDAGGVFRGVNAAVDKGRRTNEDAIPHQWYSTGCDLARVEDFTVLSTFAPGGKQVYFDRFNQISWERQVQAIKQVALNYRGSITLDTTGVGDPIYGRLTGMGVSVNPFQFTNSSKEALIDNLAMGIERGNVRLMDIPEQTNELLAYQYELTPSRNVRMNAPQGMHDDTVIALALGYWAASKPKPGAPAVGPARSSIRR